MSPTARRVPRALTALAVLAALLIATTPGADAGRSWCRKDPVVRIGDQVVRIYVSSYAEAMSSATGPTEVVITVPVGVRTALLRTDDGFGFGYAVRFAESTRVRISAGGTAITVAAYVPAEDHSLPVLVELVPKETGQTAGIARGTANAWVTARTQL